MLTRRGISRLYANESAIVCPYVLLMLSVGKSFLFFCQQGCASVSGTWSSFTRPQTPLSLSSSWWMEKSLSLPLFPSSPSLSSLPSSLLLPPPIFLSSLLLTKASWQPTLVTVDWVPIREDENPSWFMSVKVIRSLVVAFQRLWSRSCIVLND